MRNSPLACSYAVPTSELLIHRLNMTLRCHGDRYFHKILSKIGYCGLDPRINPLCAAVLKSVRHEIGVVLIWINITSEQETHGHAKGEEDGIQAGLERRAV